MGPASRLFSLAKPWLAGLLALLWVVVSVEAAGHHCENDPPADHNCAACQMAHGTLLADGAMGVWLPVRAREFVLTAIFQPAAAESSDVLLSPGRAPPA